MSDRESPKTTARCPLCRRSGHLLEECPHLPSAFSGSDQSVLSASERDNWSKLVERVRSSFDSIQKAVPFACDLAVLVGVLEDETVSPNDRALAAAAIQYFLEPLDAIPDRLPIVGYADDAVVVYLALSRLLDTITESHLAVSKTLMTLRAHLPDNRDDS